MHMHVHIRIYIHVHINTAIARVSNPTDPAVLISAAAMFSPSMHLHMHVHIHIHMHRQIHMDVQLRIRMDVHMQVHSQTDLARVRGPSDPAVLFSVPAWFAPLQAGSGSL